ncbi:MAG: flagellar basal body L-ring protein FlgH [bacterium]
MKRRAGLVLLVLWVACGCAHTDDEMPDIDIPAPIEMRGGTSAGSIWSEGLGDCYGDRRARGLGDIVTVNVVEETSASQEAGTDTSRSSALDASIDDLFGLPQDYGMRDFLNSGKPFSPSVKGGYERSFKGAGTTVRKDKLLATMSARVVQVLPGGNLVIRGKREIKVNREKQFISLEGVVRPEDISPYNTVSSTQIADAKIRYTGKGVLGDVQGPGWFARIMDWVWPL